MNQQMKLLFFVTVFGSLKGFAAEPFKALPTCGSAKVVAGTTCSNVKVEFDFAGCDLKSSPKVAPKVLCVGQTITGKLKDSGYRFEADFDKVDSGGVVSWNAKGPVRVFGRPGDVSTAPHATEVEVAKKEVVELPAISESAAKTESPEGHGASPWKVEGSVDIRYSTFSAKDDPSVPNAHAESGFGIEEGAFHAEYEKGQVSLIANIAIRRAKDLDPTPTGATVPNQSSNNNLALGTDHSDLYLKYKLSEVWALDFGQFDKIYGIEANDSKDRVFGKTGLLYDQELPVTHTGAMAEFQAHHVSFKFFAANPNNKGSYGTSTAGDENTEYGTSLGYNNDHWRGQLGYMARPISKADGSAMGTRGLMDVAVGATLGAFSVDTEFTQIADPSKNTLTPADNTDSEKPGSGVLVLATYEVSKPWLLGVRYEHLQNDPAQLSQKNAQSAGVSVHYKVSSDLETRVEAINYNYQNMLEQTWNDSRLIFSALVLF